MIDVLGLAQQRRAALIREVETLDWFIEVARQLAEEPATHDLLLNRISLDMDDDAASEPARQPETATSEAVPAPDPEVVRIEAAATPPTEEARPDLADAQLPIDTLMFKRMLTEMRRKHQEQMFGGREKVAASG